MSYFKIFNLLFCIIAIIFTSCNKENIETKEANSILNEKQNNNYEQHLKKDYETSFNKKWTMEDLQIENGMLSFKSEKELQSFIIFLSSLKNTNDWLNVFENATGFESLRSHYTKQLDYLNGVLDKNDDDFAEEFLYKSKLLVYRRNR